MQKELSLKELMDAGCAYKENGGLYLKFGDLKPFKIDDAIIETRDLDSILFLTSQEAVFEYWLSQKTLIPPWKTHWFQLKDTLLIKLRDGLLKNLVNNGIKKAGNLNKLCKRLGLSVPAFYNLVNGKNINMVSVRKLKRLLNYLDISYAYVNNKIEYTKKGNKISIKCNKFPINLLNESGAKLLGHVVSDGCIYLDKKGRNTIRTKYSSDDESVRNFIKCLQEVYGEVHITKEVVRNCSIIKIGSAIVGDSLLKCGAILGHKAKMNKRVPWLIRIGENKLKKAYLNAVFDDESCIYLNKNKNSRSYITLSRYRHLNKLTNKQKSALITLEKLMKDNKFPTGHLNKRMSMKKAVENLGGHKKLLTNIGSAPRLLVDEADMLNKLGIENRMWGSSLNKTHAGNYSVGFALFVNKKAAIKKFYKEVGFSLKHKQIKLVKAVGDKNCIEVLQHIN